MLVRSETTVSPVLGGVVPGVTVTVNRTDPPGLGLLGLADPDPVGSMEPLQGVAGEAALRGLTVPAVKSVELLSVSVQPLFVLTSAVVFDGAGAGADPSNANAVEP